MNRRVQVHYSIATWVVAVGFIATLPFYVLLYGSHLRAVGYINTQATEAMQRQPAGETHILAAMRASEQASAVWTVQSGATALVVSLLILILLARRLRMQLGSIAAADGDVDSEGATSTIFELAEIGGALASARASATEGALKLADAQHDQLTGLPGRALFFHQAEMQLKEARAMEDGSVALLYIDLDDFKKINDRHGHLCGDEVLKQVGAKLRECVRGPDAVGRIGGDEFVVCFASDTTSADQLARLAADRISSAIAEIGLNISVSVGWAISSAGGELMDLVAEADAAMYLVKEHRKHMSILAAQPESAVQPAR